MHTKEEIAGYQRRAQKSFALDPYPIFQPQNENTCGFHPDIIISGLTTHKQQRGGGGGRGRWAQAPVELWLNDFPAGGPAVGQI